MVMKIFDVIEFEFLAKKAKTIVKRNWMGSKRQEGVTYYFENRLSIFKGHIYRGKNLPPLLVTQYYAGEVPITREKFFEILSNEIL